MTATRAALETARPGSGPAARIAIVTLPAAVGAQWLVDAGSVRIGLVLLLIVAIVAAASMGSTPTQWAPADLPRPRPIGTRPAVVLGAGVVAAGVVAAVFDLEAPHTAFWWLHGTTVVVAVAAVLVADRHRRSSPRGLGPHPSGWQLTALVAVIATISVGFRVYDLTSLPEGFWFDEADYASVARHIDETGDRPLWLSGSPDAPAHYAYLAAGFMRIGFGVVASVRSVSVVFGLMAIAGAYLVGREIWGQVGAVAAMAIVGLSRWSVTVSRVGMFNVATPACLLFGLGVILVGLRRDSMTLKLVGGMTLGFGLAFHSSMAGALVGAAVLLAALTVSNQPVFRSLWVPAAGAVIVAAPILGVAARDFDMYTERQQEVSVFNGDVEDELGAIRANARAVVEAFTVEGDANGRHNIPREPLLDPVAGGLLVVGVAVAVRGLRRTGRTGLWVGLLGWGLIALVPGVLSIPSEAPNALRIIGAMPVVFLLGTAVVAAGLRTRGPRVQVVALGVLVLALTGWTVKDYFHDWRNDARVWAAHSIGETVAARTAANAAEDQTVRAIGEFFNSPVGGLLAPNAYDVEILPDEVYPLALAGDQDEMLIVGPAHRALLAEYGRVFGADTITEVRRDDELGLAVVRLTAEAVRARQGLTAVYETAAGEIMTRDERTPGGPVASLPVPLPARGTWHGLVVIDAPGRYRFELTGADDVEVTLDGADVGTDPVPVQSGPHHLVLSGSLTGQGAVDLRWQPDGGESEPIPPGRLWLSGDGPHGLWGQAFGGADGSGELSRARLDPVVDFALGQSEAARPRLIRWTGYLEVPAGGLYRLGVNAATDWTLTIDGRELDRPSETLHLAAGLHQVRLEMVDIGPGLRVALVWAPPGREQQPVPSTALSPPWVLTSDQAAAVLASHPELIVVEPDVVDMGVPDAVAVAQSGDTLAVAGAAGDVVVRRGGAEAVRSEVASEISDVGIGPGGGVVVLDPAGRLVAVGAPSEVVADDQLLRGARGLTMDEDGTVVVAATAAGRLLRADPAAGLVESDDEPPLGQPVDVLMVDGGMLVVEAEPHRVRLLAAGEAAWELPLLPTTTAAGPHLAAVGGRLFVTDPAGGHVLELDGRGRIVATYRLLLEGGIRARPVGIAATADGTLLVADPTHGLLSFRPGP